MKRIFIAAAALLFTVSALQAQTEKQTGRDGKAFHHKEIKHGRNRLAKLNLSDDQKKKLKDLNEGYRKQFTELKSNTSLSAADVTAKKEALRKEQHEKMQSLLTPEQKTQLATQRKDIREKMKDGHGKRFDKMKTDLGLTDEQTKKIKENQAGFHEKIKTIRQDQSLTETQKREQVKALSKQQRDQMKSVLTPEQLEKIKTGGRSRGMSSK